MMRSQVLFLFVSCLLIVNSVVLVADTPTDKATLLSEINDMAGKAQIDLSKHYPELDSLDIKGLQQLHTELTGYLEEREQIEEEKRIAEEEERKRREEAEKAGEEYTPPPPNEDFTDRLKNAFRGFFGRVKRMGLETAKRIAYTAIAVATVQVGGIFKPAEPDIRTVMADRNTSLDGRLRYSEACYLCTHNSFSSSADGWYPYRQQHFGLNNQLKHGVRAFMVDTYEQGGKIVFSHGDLKWQPFMRAWDTLCNRGLPTFKDWLQRTKIFLVNNPDEVVTFIIEDYVEKGSVYDTEIQAAGVQHMVLTEEILYDRGEMDDTGRPMWPTLDWMRKNNKRIVFFTSSPKEVNYVDAHGKYLMDEWKFCVENQYGTMVKEEAAVERESRSEYFSGDGEKRYLYIYNWFPTIPIHIDVGRIVSGWSIGTIIPKAKDVAKLFIVMVKNRFGHDFNVCNSAALSEGINHAFHNGLGPQHWYKYRYPNFIAVDSYHQGSPFGPMDLVNEFNEKAKAAVGLPSSATLTAEEKHGCFGPLWWGRSDGELPQNDGARRYYYPSGPGSLDDAGHPNFAALKKVAGSSKNPPVIFVHGLNCNAAAWRNLLFALNNKFAYDEIEANEHLTSFYERFNVFTFEYNSHEHGVTENARLLRAKIANAIFSKPPIFGKYKAEDITFVAHSTGGLVVRAYVAGGTKNLLNNTDSTDNRDFVGGDLKRLVTLSTPHWGSQMANLGEIARLFGAFYEANPPNLFPWTDAEKDAASNLARKLNISGECGKDLRILHKFVKALAREQRDLDYRREGRYVLFGGVFNPLDCDPRISFVNRFLAGLMANITVPMCAGLRLPAGVGLKTLGPNDSVVSMNSSLMCLFDPIPQIKTIPSVARGCQCNGEKYTAPWHHDGLLNPYEAKTVFSYILNGFTATGKYAPKRVYKGRNMAAW